MDGPARAARLREAPKGALNPPGGRGDLFGLTGPETQYPLWVMGERIISGVLSFLALEARQVT